jgi:hypothetical protein
MSDLISRKVVMDYLREQQASIIIEHNRENYVTYEATKGMLSSVEAFMNFIVQVPTACDVNTDVLINAMAKVILRSDFGNCALCDNYAKNITIDGINNGCDGNCRHDKDYTEKDITEWFKEQLRIDKYIKEGAVKDE